MKIERRAVFTIAIALMLGLLIAISVYTFGWLTPIGRLSPTGLKPQPTAQDVLQAFREERLEVADAANLEDDPNWQRDGPVPTTYKEAYRFSMPSLGIDPAGNPKATGKVFIFDSPRDLQPVRDYYEGLSGIRASHVYINDAETVLIQMPAGEVPKDKADRYGAVLKQKY